MSSWIVEEYFPGENLMEVMRSWTFNTEEDANFFYDNHEPSPGCRLRVVWANDW